MKIKFSKRLLFNSLLFVVAIFSPLTCFAQNTVSFEFSAGVKNKTTQANLNSAAQEIKNIYKTYAEKIKPFNDKKIHIITLTECKQKKLGCEDNSDSSELWGGK